MGHPVARSMRLPIVASCHTDFPRYLLRYGLHRFEPAVWPLIRSIHNAAHVNLCPSRFTQRELRDHGIENVGIWRGGVDPELFHPARRSLEMRWRLSGGRLDAPILLHVGRLSPEKNLEALRPVLDALPEARLALVGDGPARSALARAFGDHPVVFTGFLRGPALAAAYASADVLLAEPGQRRFHVEQERKTAEDRTWMRETQSLLAEYRRAMVLQRRRCLFGRIRNAFFA